MTDPTEAGEALKAAVERLEWRRNARELAATKEALDLAPPPYRPDYKTGVLKSATCIVDYADLCTVLAALQPRETGGERETACGLIEDAINGIQNAPLSVVTDTIWTADPAPMTVVDALGLALAALRHGDGHG